MERYNGWIIDEEEVPLGFFRGDGQLKLTAKIFPDIQYLYECLKQKGIVSESFERVTSNSTGDQDSWWGLPSGTINKKDVIVFNGIVKYAYNHQYYTTQTGYAILSIAQTGRERTYKRAMAKIEKYINDNLPNVRRDMVEYLKKENLIPNYVTIF